MKLTRIFTILLLFVFFNSVVTSTELNEVYKQWGNYSYVTVPGLKVYYPDSIKNVIPRIIANFTKIREKVVSNFPNSNDYTATVVLDDHDDIIDSTAEPSFDLINLSIFDEMDVVSARSYSLEKRFALSLSKTLIKQSTSNVSFTWRRMLAMLSIPHWFVEGMALNYAFPLDSLHYSRLLDMARFNRLYSLDDLNTITSQPTIVKEEMLFQAHSMLAYWESTYKKGADVELVKSIVRKYRGFDKAFKKYYGVTLKEAYKSYVNYVSQQSKDLKSFSDPDFLDVDYTKKNSKIFRSYTRISKDERLWVSSKRYTTENYDLYYKKGLNKPSILLKNVHPIFIYNPVNKEIFIGKYDVNGKREKRLILMKVSLEGKSVSISNERGSFKPLGIIQNKLYYVNIKHGSTRVIALNLKDYHSEEVLNFGFETRPLDLALDTDNQKVFYTIQNSIFITNLNVVPLKSKNIKSDSELLVSYDGNIRSLKYQYGTLWCACDIDHSTTQLFAYNKEEKRLKNYSNIPGGVWDISFSDPEKKCIEVSTLYKGGFSIASIPLKEINSSILYCNPVVANNTEELPKIESKKYQPEYHDTMWQPILGKDSEGKVLGIYNYRSDRLGRSSFMVAPTYGLKSHEWGYTSNFMNRFDRLKASISFDDYTILKGYMETDYYERDRSKKLQFEYPLKLDMQLSFGFDLVQRGIAKIKKNPRNLVPTAGKDHYYFVELKQKAIRTEPYNNIFPRKGRMVDLVYKKGVDTLFGGDMIYDSISLKWNEFIPLNNYYVLSLNNWFAQDDKHNNIRRPDDLSLGNDDYMRAYDSSYKSGDKLRYTSLNIARPIHVEFPDQIGWVRNEFSSLGVFWEMGDVRNDGKLDYDYDRGVEFASNLLIFKRLPISFKAGYAVRNGQDGHDTYFKFYTEELSEIIK